MDRFFCATRLPQLEPACLRLCSHKGNAPAWTSGRETIVYLSLFFNKETERLASTGKRNVLRKLSWTIRFCFQLCDGQVFCAAGLPQLDPACLRLCSHKGNAPAWTSGRETIVYLSLFSTKERFIGWRLQGILLFLWPHLLSWDFVAQLTLFLLFTN